MIKRFVLVSVVAVLFSAALAAQTATQGKPYVPPKTPWGDPDLQGLYTNKYEQGTPFVKPAEFEGRTLADISQKELTEIVKRRQQRAIENAPFLSGDPTGTIAGPMEFRDIYEVSKASRPWFVTDATDGKIPPTTPEARQRIAARRPTGSSFSNGVYDSYESLGLYDRCITREHWNAVEQQLIAGHVRIATALKHHEVVVLYAEDVLAQITDGDRIDVERFQQVVGPIMASLKPPVRTFCELVSLIAARGQLDVAIEIEKLGETLSRETGVNLLCAYHVQHLNTSGDDVRRLSALHDAAIAEGVAGAPIGPIVLMADDFTDGLEMYEKYLRKQGYQVVSAQDGLGAITLARMAHPAIMLLDIRMPGMSGLEAMRILKKDPLFQSVPIVALTGHALEHERKTYLADGFNEVIEKPCLPSVVAQVIQRLISAHSAS